MGWARFAFQSTVSGLSFLLLLRGVKEPLSLRVLFEAHGSADRSGGKSLDDIIGIEISNEATECCFTPIISFLPEFLINDIM